MHTHRYKTAGWTSSLAMMSFLVFAGANARALAEGPPAALANAKASNSATVMIVSPQEGEVLPVGKSVGLKLKVADFALGVLTEGSGENGLAQSAKGQHIHAIIDNGPYKAIYDVSEPFDLGELAPGVHTIEVFASRSWHESVKSPSARKAVTFYVGEKSGDSPYKSGAPLLTYSRPKGAYVGDDAKKIMVDFYLTNATLSTTDYQARITVDGESTIVQEWRPYSVSGLAPGEHTFKVELLDASGNNVPGKYNSTERTITVE